MIIKKYLHPLKVRQIDTLILGCTRYPFLKGIIQKKAGRQVYIVDSSVCVSRKVDRFLSERADIDRQLKKNKGLQLYVSDITEQFEKVARYALKRRVTLSNVPM